MRGHKPPFHMPTWTYTGTALERQVDEYVCKCGVKGERPRSRGLKSERPMPITVRAEGRAR